MRIIAQHPLRTRDLDAGQHLGRPLERGAALQALRYLEHLRHLASYTQRRVESLARVLVDHRYASRAQAAELSRRKRHQIVSIDQDSTGAHPAVTGQVTDRRKRDSRLPAAGFTDQSVGLAATNGKTQVAEDSPLPTADPKKHIEVLDTQRVGVPLYVIVAIHASNTLCRPSVTKFTPTTSEAVAAASNSTVHQ